MAEEKARILRVLEALSEQTAPARPSAIGSTIGETPLNVGHDLYELGKGGLAEKPDKKESLWLITDKGRETIENPPISWVENLTGKTSGENLGGKLPIITLPSRADSFKEIGEHLGIGTRGDIKLDAIIYYLQRTADMEDLDAVWNALTEMGVVSDVKKRWIKLYSQTFSGKKVSEELSKKLETDKADDKVTTQAEKTEGPPIAKRFSVVNGQILSDPEGEYTFSMAMQKAMAESGASSSQASEVAATFANTLNTILPLLTKESPPQDNTMVQLLQQRIEQLADDKHKAEMETLRAEIKSGQRSPEADQQVQALSQQIADMREALHSQELERVQEHNQALINQLSTKLGDLESQIAAAAQGKQAASKIGLLSEALKATKEELSGIRSDFKSMAPTILKRGASPRERTASEKAGFGTGLDKGIEKAQTARALEEALFFGKES